MVRECQVWLCIWIRTWPCLTRTNERHLQQMQTGYALCGGHSRLLDRLFMLHGFMLESLFPRLLHSAKQEVPQTPVPIDGSHLPRWCNGFLVHIYTGLVMLFPLKLAKMGFSSILDRWRSISSILKLKHIRQQPNDFGSVHANNNKQFYFYWLEADNSKPILCERNKSQVLFYLYSSCSCFKHRSLSSS